MKKFKKIMVLGLASLTLAGLSTPVFAQTTASQYQEESGNEVHYLSENEIDAYGANPPKPSASTHNLSVSDYNYQVSKIGYRVYTDKWLTGTSTINVYVENWNPNTSNGGGAAGYKSLSVKLYDENGYVKSKDLDFYEYGDGSFSDQMASFTGLSSSKKYYVLFEVPTNAVTYSFNGSITN